MRRREFLRVSSGATGATAMGASATAAAQQGGTATSTPAGTTTAGGNATETATGPAGGGNATGTAGGNATGTGGGNASAAGGGGGGGGGTATVELVDYAFEPGTDEPLYISPGTTVTFVWVTPSHNIVVDSQPEGANWQGHQPVEGAGFEYEHTFETTGEYAIHCQPHLSLGMEGTIVVNEQGAPPGGGGGGGEVEPEEMGVPFQAHYVGLATLVGIFVVLVFTFFFLKYGTTPNSGYPEDR